MRRPAIPGPAVLARAVVFAVFSLALGLSRAGSQAAETGIASWYGEPFHGRKTASGEIFDKNAMTAAHKTLPFGTLVLVTNRDNGRKVVVRINDRGPFVDGRIIDLSEMAARYIGLDSTGTARVIVEKAPEGTAPGPYGDPGVIELPSGKARADLGGSVAIIQVASFSDEGKAARLVERLRLDGIVAELERSGSYRRVLVRTLPADAERMAERLRALGFRSLWIRVSQPAP